MTHDVFISYSTKDKTIADAVCAKLEENNIRVWIAPRDVAAGANFAGSIVEAIETCKIFVLIWSSDANVSKHILNEINQAFDQGIIIIPFRIQDVQPSSAMRYYIGNTHWLDAIDPPLENHIATLINSILVNLGREPKPDLPTSPSEDAPILSALDKEPDIEKSGAVSLVKLSPGQKKVRKIDKKMKTASAAPVKWARFIPLAAIALVAITLVVLLISGVFTSSPPAGIAENLPSETPTIAATRILMPSSTPWPTRTATPATDWVEEFSEPILAAINIQPPDFADDFSQVDPTWIYQPHNLHSDEYCLSTDGATMSVYAGSMKCSLDANCRQAVLYNGDFDYNNFVLQTDINFEQTRGTIGFMMFYPAEYELGFSLASYGYWIFQPKKYGDLIEEIEGHISFDPSKPVTLTIINQCPTYLVYVNSSLLVARNDLEICNGPASMVYNMFNEDHITEVEIFELDNVKVWDLDTFE
jgi:hypothetical protein